LPTETHFSKKKERTKALIGDRDAEHGASAPGDSQADSVAVA
jgi:hypothetical protein